MAKKDDRFVAVYSQTNQLMTQTEIWVDKLTGVNYVFHASGYAGGLTPLLDAQGRVMVSEIPEE